MEKILLDEVRKAKHAFSNILNTRFSTIFLCVSFDLQSAIISEWKLFSPNPCLVLWRTSWITFLCDQIHSFIKFRRGSTRFFKSQKKPKIDLVPSALRLSAVWAWLHSRWVKPLETAENCEEKPIFMARKRKETDLKLLPVRGELFLSYILE